MEEGGKAVVSLGVGRMRQMEDLPGQYIEKGALLSSWKII